MRTSTRSIGLMLGCLALPLAAVAATKPTSAPTSASATASGDPVARGEYLSKAAHCNACHSREGGPAYSGNVPLNSPFGVLYAPNITQDPTTGIGNWTEKEFEGSLRRGVGKDGQYLYPAMPYIEFTKISDDDIHALWAYFRTIKPVREETKKNEMKFPFNVRVGIAGWQAMYFKQGRYANDPSQSAQWNRGAYLVQGLGHCEACHTPTNVAMAPKKGEALQGNVIDHWFAPDISGGQFSGIKDWSVEQLATYLKQGHNDKNEAAVGPMQQTIDLGTSQLSDADVTAISVYLKNQVTTTADREPKTKHPVTAIERASGKAIFADNCASCHGNDGKGVAGIAPSLVGAASVAGKEPETALRAVLQGFEPHGQWGVMPSFAQVFTPQEVSDVVNYVRTAWGNAGAGSSVTPSQVTRLARYSDLGGAKVESALVCPSAQATALDAMTLAQVKALADDTQPQAATDKLVRDYRSRHPKVGTTDIVTTISGAYCRDVMATSKGTLADRQKRYVAFTGTVAQAVSTTR